MRRVHLGLTALAMTTILSACGGGDDASPTPAASTAPDSIPSSSAKASVASTTPLTITGQPQLAISVGSTYYFNANTTGGSGNPVTFSITNRPSWLTLNPATGELRGTASTAGTYSNIIIGASDGMSSTTMQPFSIVVNGSGSSGKVTVTVTWAAPSSNTDGSTFDNPAGFVIHYGTSASNLNQSVSIGSYSARSYNLSGLSAGSTYYFSVAAVNTTNTEGERSAITSIAL